MHGRSLYKVMLVIGSLDVGGAESQLALLASGLVARGYSVQVFAIDACGTLRQRLPQAGATVCDGGYRTTKSLPLKLLRLSRALWRLWLVLLTWRPVVVHAFLPMAGLFAVIAGRLAFVPRIIVGRRALGTHQDRHPYWRSVDRIVSVLAHAITANSLAVARDTAMRDGIAPHKIVVIPNGIETTRFASTLAERMAVRSRLNLQDDQTAIVCVANLIAYKGHLDLIDAFAIVRRAEPGSRLFLLGADRGQGAALRERMKKLGVADEVVQLGHCPDVASVLAAMDIAVLPSHEEGLSNALLEYLAAGLPVVATAVGGNAEVIEGVPGCWLVPPRAPSLLAEALIAAIRSDRGPGDSAARKRAVADRFSPDAMVARYLAVYGIGGKHVRAAHSENGSDHRT